ncbi:MAG: hypothetical protein FRX48_04555 [Lasallia pustulata]|uniref:Ubiquinol-cytochrome c chaperone domain-containing protein n=1 Tax=Lasallia pustulata TaxID=136370 RepID=A0A5M8PQP7_9LECA|nr:MAG: hypothetical protein FRX48_04555 [Lasallia pustulata]
MNVTVQVYTSSSKDCRSTWYLSQQEGMTSKTHCSACLRVLRQRQRSSVLAPQLALPTLQQHGCRLFSTSLAAPAAQVAPIKTPSPIPVHQKNPAPPANPKKTPQRVESSPTSKLAKAVRQRASAVTETYVAYGACESLVNECAAKADYSIPQTQEKGVEIPKTTDGEDLGVGTGWWYEELGLTPTFNTWAQITFLHMYLLTVRFRCFPPSHAPTWHQHLLDHFFYRAEERMTVMHNVHARAVRNKYLKDLFVQWRGLTAGYDEGVIRGDAVLAAAVWRNVFKGAEEVDLRKLAMVVSYMRRCLNRLEGAADENIVGGDVKFGDPGREAAWVKVRSKMMDQPIKDEELKPKGKAGS